MSMTPPPFGHVQPVYPPKNAAVNTMAHDVHILHARKVEIYRRRNKELYNYTTPFGYSHPQKDGKVYHH
jgi:hypothetical protein